MVKGLGLKRLPEPVVTRRKSGLALPLRDWMRDSEGMGLDLDMLLEPRSLEREYLEAAAVRKVVETQRSGEADHAELLWGLAILELWQRVLVESSDRP